MGPQHLPLQNPCSPGPGPATEALPAEMKCTSNVERPEKRRSSGCKVYEVGETCRQKFQEYRWGLGVPGSAGEALVLVTQLTARDSVLENLQARPVEEQISSGTVRLHRDKVHQYTQVGFCQLGCTKCAT